MRLLLDTNVVLRSAFRRDPSFHAVNNAVLRHLELGDELLLAPQTIFEAWIVMTRPEEVNGLGLDIASARREVELLRQAFNVLDDPKGIVDTWLSLGDTYGIHGKAAHDARLVAFMLHHEIRGIITLNPADFRRYAEIEVLSP